MVFRGVKIFFLVEVLFALTQIFMGCVDTVVPLVGIS